MDEGRRFDTTDKWFAVNLKAARERAGLSQEAVAQRMREEGFPGFRQQTVGRIEAGERGVQVGEGLVLAQITRTSLNTLAQPPELMQDARVLRTATGNLRRLRDEVVKAIRGEALAERELRQAVARLREAGKADALAEDMRQAGQALAETVTLSEVSENVRRAVAGPSEQVIPGGVESHTDSV